MASRCVIYGAGRTATFFLEYKNREVEIIAVVDNDKEKWGKQFGNCVIENPGWLRNNAEFDFVIVCSVYGEEIVHDLYKKGITIDNIVVADFSYYDSIEEFFETKYERVFCLEGAQKIVEQIATRDVKRNYCSKIDRKLSIDFTNVFINIDNPVTLNDKIRLIETGLYSELTIVCTDKYQVRKYVEYCGLGDILIPLLDVYDSVDEIDFSIKRDEKVIFKCTHSCGANAVVDGNDRTIEYAKYFLRKKLKQKMSLLFQEWHYERIIPRIICEKFMEDGMHERLIDYKYFCCNGEPKCILVCCDRDEAGESKHKYYDEQWQELPYAAKEIYAEEDVPRPEKLDRMTEIVRRLAKPFPFVRVDLYSINGGIYFGELTFTDGAGSDPFSPRSFDLEMAKRIKLGRVLVK